MITGEKILEVSGKKDSSATLSGMGINIALDEVKVNGENIEMTYEYTASYDEKVGFLKIRGIITTKEDKKIAKEVSEEWGKSKKLPDTYAEMVLAAINYSGSANGTLIARVLGLSAPLIPPRIQLSKKE